MKSIATALVLVGLVPIEVLSSPAPIALGTFLIPFAVLVGGIPAGRYSYCTIFALLIGGAMAVAHSLYSFSLTPILSFLSFGNPIAAIFVGLTGFAVRSLSMRVVGSAWILGLFMSGAMISNLLNNDLVARTAVEAVSDRDGYYYAASVAGSIFGAPMFASFGVNSFAGILISMVFLTLLSASENDGVRRTASLFSAVVLLAYGLMLESRMFFLGVAVFSFMFLIGVGARLFVKFVTIVAMCVGLGVIVYTDERLAFTFTALSDGSLTWDSFAALTSNRLDLLTVVPSLAEMLVGSAFGDIVGPEHESSSFHLYVVTLFAKGGVVFSFPVLYVLLSSVMVKRSMDTRALRGRIVVRAAIVSFFVQSFVWDVFAVQVFGHVAWFFVGLGLSGMVDGPLVRPDRSARQKSYSHVGSADGFACRSRARPSDAAFGGVDASNFEGSPDAGRERSHRRRQL